MKTTNFDHYLDEHMQDPTFAARFEQAGEAWDAAVEPGGAQEVGQGAVANAPTEQKQLARGCSRNERATPGNRPTK